MKEVQAEFDESPDLAALHYFLLAAKSRGVVPTEADVRALRAHTGTLGVEHDYIVVEYPRYPAVVIDRGSDESQYFVLGQSPDARTTLRLLSPEMNANLGPGCESELEVFLELLSQHSRE